MYEYPAVTPPPKRCPSSVRGLSRPPILYSCHCAFPATHHPEYTYHGHHLAETLALRCLRANCLASPYKNGLYLPATPTVQCLSTATSNSALNVPRHASDATFVPTWKRCAKVHNGMTINRIVSLILIRTMHLAAQERNIQLLIAPKHLVNNSTLRGIFQKQRLLKGIHIDNRGAKHRKQFAHAETSFIQIGEDHRMEP